MPQKRQKGSGNKASSKTTGPKKKFPIVGLGASAGGLEALKSFFAAVPQKSGLAYIVVIHMSADKPSILPELLQKVTRISVKVARENQAIEPDTVYVMPPSKVISVNKGIIRLEGLGKNYKHHPINSFFSSLALDQGKLAVAVVLSGTGTDGSDGAQVIKVHEGLVFAQTPNSAKYDSMPSSAIQAMVVDKVLAPEEIPAAIMGYFEHHLEITDEAVPGSRDDDLSWLPKLLSLLRTVVGHDFSSYKMNTILRRVTRRMSLNQLDDPERYLSLLRDNPDEVKALFREFLTGVTSFFRDPESFTSLYSLLPQAFADIGPGKVFRVWVPGCSTGEEVYSLAILFREYLDQTPQQVTLQIFGTDIDNLAIEKARAGLYPGSIADDMSQKRLRTYFIEEGGFYRIRQDIRDSIVFSVQDVLKDPPFSRLNMLCCRNLMIYLDAAAQKRLLPLFHYTLEPGGILVLGSSETIGGFTNLFSVLDNKWKIYKQRYADPGSYSGVEFPSGSMYRPQIQKIGSALPLGKRSNIGTLVRDHMLECFSPAALLIDSDATIQHIIGRMGKYLEFTTGSPTRNVLEMARVGLRIELSSAIRATLASKNRETRRNLRIQTNGDVQNIDLHVVPLDSPKELAGMLLVVFEDVEASGAAEDFQKSAGNDPSRFCEAMISDLEKELKDIRESHKVTLEELESSNEELKSSNEELQSSNEELQSSNEELVSSKEELQSLNEELQTLNSELQSKVEELSEAHDDMRNLMNSTEIATIFVDNEFCVKRFTPESIRIVNLIPTDIGRPLEHIMSNLEGDVMIPALKEVLEGLTSQELEVQTTDGKWYKMRIMPYRTMDNRIAGGVLTFADINDQKKAQEVLAKVNTERNKA